MKVYRYVLEKIDAGTETKKIPSENLLGVDNDGETIVVYALVDSDNLKLVEYEFKGVMIGIQFELEEGFVFLGTAKTCNNKHSFHVFYKKVV